MLGIFENVFSPITSGYLTQHHLRGLSHIVKVASPIVDQYTASPALSFDSFADSITSFLQLPLESILAFLHRVLPYQIAESTVCFLSKADSTTLVTLLLPSLFLLFSMSGWGRRFWPSGRYSPFAATGTGPPTVTDDDYHYLGPDDIVDPPSRRTDPYGFPHSHHSPSHNDPLSPDIMILKHLGTTYPLHFPAFSIAEGKLGVHELRRLAAKELKCDDPRRIKLLYKGRVLKDDARACKEEGLKQNSELMCVVSEGPAISDSRSEMESSESASEPDERSDIGGPTVDVDGTIRQEPRKRKGHRGGRRKKGRGDNSGGNTPQPRDSGFLAPSSVDTGSGTRSRSPSRPTPSQTSTAPSPPPAQSSKTQSPAAAQLDQLERLFHREFVPKCVHFTSHPPSDAKTRDFEYKKLSETILAQVILKLDAVETAGDDALRGRRKDLVKETQQVLNGLDAVGKGKNP